MWQASMFTGETLKVSAEQCASAPASETACGAATNCILPALLQIKYSSLPNYEDREEEFKAEAVLLRRRFTHEGQLRVVRIPS